MAANEHKNLQDINRHNPKGFEGAYNDTVLSKNEGSGATSVDGTLEWQSKSLLGTTNHKMQGFCASTLTNYSYGEDIADTKSPFEMAVDFGSSSATGATVTPSAIFRVGQGVIITATSTVSKIYGWITSSAGTDVTLAICKVTPAAGVTTALTPVVIDEITVTGLSNNSKLIAINETTITAASIAAGDIVFPMVKDATATSSVYLNIIIETSLY